MELVWIHHQNGVMTGLAVAIDLSFLGRFTADLSVLFFGAFVLGKAVLGFLFL
jgi:hypothetical protein